MLDGKAGGDRIKNLGKIKNHNPGFGQRTLQRRKGPGRVIQNAEGIAVNKQQDTHDTYNYCTTCDDCEKGLFCMRTA